MLNKGENKKPNGPREVKSPNTHLCALSYNGCQTVMEIDFGGFGYDNIFRKTGNISNKNSVIRRGI